MNPAQANCMATREDTAESLSLLNSSELNDFEADVMLQQWCKIHPEERLVDACYAVLTSACSPPRLGATVQAVRLAGAAPSGAEMLWSRFLPEARTAGPARMTNWIAGFYYHRFDTATFEHFVTLASLVPERVHRVAIGIMLSTWSSMNDNAAKVMEFIDALLLPDVEGAS